MNERIKQLAEAADQLAEDELVHLERVHNRLYSFTESREIYNQKFAELIVKMCADAADMAYDARCEYVGDYVGEYMGYGEEEGITAWRNK